MKKNKVKLPLIYHVLDNFSEIFYIHEDVHDDINREIRFKIKKQIMTSLRDEVYFYIKEMNEKT